MSPQLGALQISEERLEVCESAPEAFNGDATGMHTESDLTEHGDAATAPVIHNPDSEDATAEHTSYSERVDSVYNTG